MELLLATSNAGKVQEIRECLSGLPLSIVTPQEKGIEEQPREDKETFEENALLKARFYHKKTGLRTLADDSGILVDALAGELGVFTRRWGAGPLASDEEWITFFLDRMKKETNKRARFVCVLAFIDEHGEERLFEGTCEGTITESLEASYLPGLPISACFRPDGYDRVYSAMTTEQKNAVSHRGRALEKLKTFLHHWMH